MRLPQVEKWPKKLINFLLKNNIKYFPADHADLR
jgi:hypothetical protein